MGNLSNVILRGRGVLVSPEISPPQEASTYKMGALRQAESVKCTQDLCVGVRQAVDGRAAEMLKDRRWFESIRRC